MVMERKLLIVDKCITVQSNNNIYIWASPARLVMGLNEFENYPWRRVAIKVLMDSVKGKNLQSLTPLMDLYIFSRCGFTIRFPSLLLIKEGPFQTV